ncbi:hypothetical protein [Neobacillus niacini]|uniref:hypothetical protein n=1 Tax=Neobacillus niacini TaxID=86668 RepID=UPI002855FDA8|nr:hypothetical protein [Neobacillus niacini]MDR7002659.1 hypothetical protein [Neobacillus niacini]
MGKSERHLIDKKFPWKPDNVRFPKGMKAVLIKHLVNKDVVEECDFINAEKVN